MKHHDPKPDSLLTPKQLVDFLWTPEQLAKRWQVTTLTIRRYRKSGRLSALHIGRSIRFSLDEISRFETESKV